MNLNLHFFSSSKKKKTTSIMPYRIIFRTLTNLLLLLVLILFFAKKSNAQSSDCTLYAISNATPICSGITGTGVFFTRDDCNDTHVAWKAGPNLYLSENGDGTATITGTVINGSQVGTVAINLTGKKSTGQLWTSSCYQDNLGSNLSYYEDFLGTITVGSTAYTIEDRGNQDFGIGSGASNQGQGLGFGAWSGGTWGSCTELMGNLTQVAPFEVEGVDRSTCGADSVILSTNTPIVYYEMNGEVVIEAENYSEMVTQSGWVEETEQTGAVGNYMIVPNGNGAPFFPYGEGPKLIYKVKVTTPGTYNVYSRGYATNGGDDSAWVGINGDSLGQIAGAYGRWHWTNLGSYTLSAGAHELEISQRENGYILDRMMLSLGTGPAGQESGPAESARTVAPVSYTWMPGNHTGRSVILRPTTTTNYTVNVTFENGCVVTDDVTAYVTPAPNVLCYFHVGNGWEQVCEKIVTPGTAVSLSAHPAINNHTWEWTGPNGFTATGRDQRLGNVTTDMEGTYMVKYTNEYGCSDVAALNLFVNDKGDVPCTDAVTTASADCWDEEITDCVSCSASNVTSLWKLNGSFNNDGGRCYVDQPGNFFALLEGSVGKDVFFTLRDNNTAFTKGNFTYNGEDYILNIEYSSYRNDSGINCDGYQNNKFAFKAVNGWYKNCATGEKTEFETSESIHIGYNAAGTEIVLEGWYNNSPGIWRFTEVNTDCDTGEGTTTESCDNGTSITYGNGSITMNGGSFYQILNTQWAEVYNCGWQCGTTKTVDNLPAGEYRIYIKNSTYQVVCEKIINLTEGNGGGTGGNPCDSQGGDSDGDGICDNQDNCDDIANPDQADNDGDGIGNVCDPTPNGNGGGSTGDTTCTDVTASGGAGLMTINNIPTAAKVEISGPSTGWGLQKVCEGNCSGTETVNNLTEGTYSVKIQTYNPYCYAQVDVTVTGGGGGTGGTPCDNQGGDSDGDGICDNQDNCDDTANPDQADNDGDGIGNVCDSTPNGNGGGGTGGATCTDVTASGGAGLMTINNIPTTAKVEIAGPSTGWGLEVVCEGNCSGTETVNNLTEGVYSVKIQTFNPYCYAQVEVTVTNGGTTGGAPCDNQGGDSDGDGVCDNQDNCDFSANPDQADTDGDGIGNVCDSTPNGDGGDNELCVERTITEFERCGGEIFRRLAIPIEGYNWRFPWTSVSFKEYANGTARIIGAVRNLDDPTIEFDVDVTYTGRTFTAPTDSPKLGGCQTPDPSGFYYYTDLTGTLTGKNAISGAKINIQRKGEAPQVGYGANLVANSLDFGTSAWFMAQMASQPTNHAPLSVDEEGHGDIHFILSDEMPSCLGGPAPKELCMERTATSYERCGGETINRLAIPLEGYNWRFPWTNVRFKEYADGTASIIGAVKNLDDPSIEFHVAATFTGRTSTAPIDSPKLGGCQTPDPSGFYYYTDMTGTLTGLNAISGAKINIQRKGEAFQLGYGANVIANSLDFGASAWFMAQMVSQPTNHAPLAVDEEGNGDFNFVLSDGMPSCLGGANMTNGATVNCGNLAITYGAGTISMAGPAGESYYFKINDLNDGWAQAFGCGWNCGNEQTATNLPNSKYLITIQNEDWSQHCSVEIEMTNSSFVGGASSRNAAKLNFEAFPAQRAVDLQWLTNSGYKVVQFEIERSTDGANFEQLAKSTNKLWSEQLEYHQTSDLTPAKGINHYRVKETYLDGSFAYTDVKQVGFNIDLDNLSMYPNPVANVLNFNLKPVLGKATKIQIINNFGQVVQRINFEKVLQESVGIELDKHILNGFYQVHIEVEGQKAVTKKLIVKRLY